MSIPPAPPSTGSSSSLPESSGLETKFGNFRSTSEASAFERWRASLVNFTGLGLSDEDKMKRDELKGLEREEAQWRRCETWKNDLMKNSPVVVFMLKHLALHSTNLTSAHIHCAPCDPSRAGGFSPDAGILLCQDRFMSKTHMQDTLVHEMVHVYDHARFKVDWSNLRHHACSEVEWDGVQIRAASLSGDSTSGTYLLSSHTSVNLIWATIKACARRRAVLSVMANPACKSQEEAERAVNEVWESCFKDTRPFDEVPDPPRTGCDLTGQEGWKELGPDHHPHIRSSPISTALAHSH
ncbi:peptidase family M76 protein [Rhizoctonia solani]|uniref:Mitochondrial inner membrane protease ATP23 n=1 Tax=Rhizoctonia solani TaxID=456999 RepID=A0A8H8NXN4_9AGAM|nr:peptidase family M76 protein [Rhizoctonia solani]QRW22021.1 peptidase family M76 protein [Rhizoctonia solani]